MKRAILVGLIAAAAGSAQTPTIVNSRVGGPVTPNGYRYGNILHPGGMPSYSQTHAGRLGATISGRPIPGVTGRGPYGGGGGFGGGGRNRTIVVPYAVPVYYDPGYYGYAQQEQQQPNITVVVPQQPAPSVVINHNYSPDNPQPVLRDYSGVDLPKSGLQVFEGPKSQDSSAAPAPKSAGPTAPATAAARATVAATSDSPTIYLVALKDGTLRQAIGWWIEGETLQYITPRSAINRVSLNQVDEDLSKKLNAERNLEFELHSR